MALFEIREYPVKDGKMDEWVTFMEDKVVPFIVAKGMVPVAMFRCPKNPNLYIWIRRFEDEAQKAALYSAVYETEEWQRDYKPIVRAMVDVENAVVHEAEPTSRSPVQ